MLMGTGMNVTTRRGGGFNPASIFAPADDGWYWQPSLTTTFTDAARTTPTTVGNPVGGVTDLSGKGKHGSQVTASARMTLRQAANGSYYYESDTSEDVLQTAFNIDGKRITLAMAFRPLARTFMLLMNAGAGSPYSALGIEGGAGSQVYPPNSVYFDNVLFTGTTAGELYTAAQSATSVIYDFNPGAGDWLNPAIGKYQSGPFYTPGDTFATLAIDREITATERANITASFMALVP